MRSEIVGRAPDLAELRRALGDALDGHGSLVLIAGEPGIGKTRLAEEVVDAGTAAGATTAWASCWEGDGAPAYWPWIQIVRSLVGDADTDLVPWSAGAQAGPAEAADAGSARFQLFDETGTFLRRAASRGPLVLVIDDVHWADVPSTLLLRFVARELRGVAALVVATYRDVELDRTSELGRAIADLARDAHTLVLGGLAPDEVVELLAQVTGAAPEAALAGTVHERSGGNPLFVRELGRLFVAQGRAHRSVPESVRPVLERRLARLSQPCFDAMAVASVVGQRFRADVLGRVSDAARLPGLLDEAQRARVIDAEQPGLWAFTHALVRDVLYEGLAASTRCALHRAVGEALEASGDEHAAELAHHFFQAGELQRALDHAERAGRLALEMLAYEDAAAHFARAVEAVASTADDDRRTSLLLALGDARLRAGDMPAARDAFEQAAELARRRGSAEDLARAALGFGAGLSGFEVRLFDHAQLDLLSEALEALGPRDSTLRAWILARLSVALSMAASEERRVELAEEAIAMARRLGDRSVLAYALATHCDAISGPADAERRLAQSTEMIAIAEGRDRPLELLGRRLRLVALLELGDVAGVDAEIDAFARSADALRQPLYQWYVPLWRATRALMQGRLDDAVRLAEEAAAIGERAQSKNAWMLTRVLRHCVYSDQGMEAEAFAEMEVLGSDPELGLGATAMGIYAPTTRPAHAKSLLDRFAASAFADLPVDAEWLPTMCQMSEACAALRHLDAAAGIYERLAPHAALFGAEGIGAGTYGSVARHLGLLAAVLGDDAAAVRHFDAALAANRRAGAPALVAHTLRQYGSFLLERGDRERGEAMLREALDTYTSLGYELRAGAVRAVLGSGPSAPSGSAFRRDGELWTLSYAGRTVHLKDAKGLHDIASLLSRPGREVHVADLIGSIASGDAGPVLDDRARREYRARLAELQDELDEAERYGDVARSEKARGELDFLAGELASALGLGGRARTAGDPAERARKAVTQRIRNALTRIQREHPELARHLEISVKTGRFCCYAPEHGVDWAL